MHDHPINKLPTVSESVLNMVLVFFSSLNGEVSGNVSLLGEGEHLNKDANSRKFGRDIMSTGLEICNRQCSR